MVTIDMIKDAQKALEGVARKTDIIPLNKIMDNVYMKSENLQLTGSFKLRGAYYKISTLTEEERERGVIAASAGNHAQGTALSATKRGIKSYICIPAGAPLSKIEATKSLGGEVILVPGVFDDAYAECLRLVKEKNYTLIHPFNDPCVIAGQGTIGLEILEQLPDADTIVVPIGGGGLISGVACAVKALKPSCKVIGVQAAVCASMYESRKAGKVVKIPDAGTLADGIHVLEPGNLTFEMVQKYVDEIVTVSEDEIAGAILALMEGHKVVAEGAGATTIAACMYGKVPTEGHKVVCVVSGGNIDVTTLTRVITKGLTKSGRLTKIKTKVVDKPGQLIHLLELVSATGANIMSVNHEREDKNSEVNSCVVKMVLETRDLDHSDEIAKILAKHGYDLY